MYWKLLAVMVSVVLIGAALLGLRAQRQDLHHQITQMHVQVDQARHQTWDAQVRIAERTSPRALRAAAKRAGIELEAAVPRDLRAAGRAGDRLAEAHSAGPHQ